jgi:hypothetical protein
VDYTDTAWAGRDQDLAQHLQGGPALRHRQGQEEQVQARPAGPDPLNDELYRQFLEELDDSERLIVKRGDGQGLYALGFTDVVNFDGVDVTYEYGIPSGLGYGWSAWTTLELCSLQGQLFVPRGRTSTSPPRATGSASTSSAT